MKKTFKPIDKVRASRDGHEYHEAWTARKALQLVVATDNLIGIAVEGLSPTDQSSVGSETVEIADIVLYHGKRPTFRGADSINIVQFKYSISASTVAFRVSDAKKTIAKFASAYREHKKLFGENEVQSKLEFELITNRPIYGAFSQAIEYLSKRKRVSGDVKKQANQFKLACGLDGTELTQFAGKFRITGLTGTLAASKRDLSRVLIDWSAAYDPEARARLGALKQLVRDKAGSEGQDKNLIVRTDVLAALDVQDESELFPCPASFPEIGSVVQREQLSAVLDLINESVKPIIIHAAGGMGKTVFLESLVKALSNRHEVILFDCFGGGAYRAPEDSRHLPKRGLIHIANTLACRGLCDPLLPRAENLEELVKAFRRRLEQCLQTLRRASPDKQLILFIDAIDNAAVYASEHRQPSFPTVLLQSFHYRGHIPGVKIVGSCRSHRLALSKGEIECHEFLLSSFTLAETTLYLRDRFPSVTQAQIQVAYARSGGNPRILAHLVSSDRGLLEKSEIQEAIELNDLLRNRIEKALSEAKKRGYSKEDTDAFLAGLSVLPPPVPLDEYAKAHGMEVSAIESFAADLAPLLERTKHGLMFRDEPTETLIREEYASNLNAVRRVASNLLKHQDSSVYAARALPGLLQKLDDSEQLFKLAFDERFPQAIESTIGKRNIRYARIKAAVHYAAYKRDSNRLVPLLVELSTVAAVDHKGINYILDFPDLVILARDVDATRRLFETRTSWPGTRHARMTIAHTLASEPDEAFRHAIRADEWINHYSRQDWSKRDVRQDGPDHLDIASIPLCLIVQGKNKNAILYLRGWKDWYAYEVGEHLFGLLEVSGASVNGFVNALTNEMGVIASALSFAALQGRQQKQLIRKLGKICRKRKVTELPDRFVQKTAYVLRDGVLKASAIAASLGLRADAARICSVLPSERPGCWSFRDHFSMERIFPFVAHLAVAAVATKKEVREWDILPKDLMEVAGKSPNMRNAPNFKERLLAILENSYRSNGKSEKGEISYEQKREMEHFINERLESLLLVTKAFAKVLGSPLNKADAAFVALLEVWGRTRKSDRYGMASEGNLFFQALGAQIASFTLWVREDLKPAPVKAFLDCLHNQEIVNAPSLIKVVQSLATRSPLHSLAGEEVVKAKTLIEREDEVTSRASLLARLGRAIAPASNVEATALFKAGLEQLDAIGSGDYKFTNELLMLASSLKGEELPEREFHTLTNICELNMYEAEKFPWYAFATGLSRTAGYRGLAKLGRWHDRSKISLDYTLLPYLTALIDDNKIKPEDALALLRLSDPAELWACNTARFAKALDSKSYPNHDRLVRELIKQFEDNNPGIPMDETVKALAVLADKYLDKASETAMYLAKSSEQFKRVREENNDNMNYRSMSGFPRPRPNGDRKKRRMLRALASKTVPSDEASMARAIEALNSMDSIHDFKEGFFGDLRIKVPFAKRGHYVEIIARLENLDSYTKLNELAKCKEVWSGSSIALNELYKSLGIPLVQIHIDDLVSFGTLSGYRLKEFSEVTGVPITDLILEVIRLLASSNDSTEPSVWLGLASFMCDESDAGVGQAALSRLLNSASAQLASSVEDGEWTQGLYPPNDETKIVSGLIWMMLGAPLAADRWRAAHSVRCLARFERWSVINDLVEGIGRKDAHAFQAPNLKFYYLHARLWLLIALARVAMEYPEQIARYCDRLVDIALDRDSPHVLMRYFASQAILNCLQKGTAKLEPDKERQIREVNKSPFPSVKRKPEDQRDSFYLGRPKDIPAPDPEFHLDYDFHKYDVHSLSAMFGKSGWTVKDMLTEEVRRHDNSVTHMWDSGGRERRTRQYVSGMNSRYHSYGEQLGWHALLVAAGKLLSEVPVTEESYSSKDPWKDWLEDRLLTREDGLWLSDGMDRPPLELKTNLREQGKEGLVVTGEKAKILSLIFDGQQQRNELTVKGRWSSPDGIAVRISSALVAPDKAHSLARRLIREKPFLAWLPSFDRYDEESLVRKGYLPWIVSHSSEARLDKDDPLGAPCAVSRPYFVEGMIAAYSLKANDPFKRAWKAPNGEVVGYSDAWQGSSNRYDRYDEESSPCGIRLVCSNNLLRKILAAQKKDLLVLVQLQRYEKGIGGRDSKYFNTIAVIHINRKLKPMFYKGAVNRLHQ